MFFFEIKTGCYDFSNLSESLNDISKENEKEEQRIMTRFNYMQRIPVKRSASSEVKDGTPTKGRKIRRRLIRITHKASLIEKIMSLCTFLDSGEDWPRR